jgi:hypothetical protein
MLMLIICSIYTTTLLKISFSSYSDSALLNDIDSPLAVVVMRSAEFWCSRTLLVAYCKLRGAKLRGSHTLGSIRGRHCRMIAAKGEPFTASLCNCSELPSVLVY